LENRSRAVLVARVNLHCSRCLCTATADALIKPIDALNVAAVVTNKDDAIRVFGDCVHASTLLFPFPQDVHYRTDRIGDKFPTTPGVRGARRGRPIDEADSLPPDLATAEPVFMLAGAPQAHEVSSKRLGSRFCSSPKLCPEACPIKASDHPIKNGP
jgi:hypothetical protein